MEKEMEVKLKVTGKMEVNVLVHKWLFDNWF